METTKDCYPPAPLDAHLHKYMGTYSVINASATSLPAAGNHLNAACRKSWPRLPPALAAQDVKVPALHCSFPSPLHPSYELVKEQCDGWILDVAQPPSPAARQLLVDCLLPRLSCRTMASAPSVTRLIHVVKLIAWLMIADDDDDHPQALGADQVTSSHRAAEVLSILRRRHPPTSCCMSDADADDTAASGGGVALQLPTSPPIRADGLHMPSIIIPCKRRENREKALIALAALWADMLTEMGDRLRARFVAGMEDYFDAVKVQAAYRKANRIPDIQAYKEIRRQASFILPCLVLMEYALGIELDDATYAEPRLKELRNAITEYIWLCNDVVSCKVEIGVEDYFNMPSIVYSAAHAPHDKGWTLQGAVDHVAEMTRELDAQCVSMLNSITAQLQHAGSARSEAGSSSPAIIKIYLDGLCSCMSGSLAWHLESARYALSH